MVNRVDIPQEHRDCLADYIQEFIDRHPDASDQYQRGLRAAELLIRDGDKPLGWSMAFIELPAEPRP